MVLVEVIDDIGRTSSHLEWASKTFHSEMVPQSLDVLWTTAPLATPKDEAVPLVEMVGISGKLHSFQQALQSQRPSSATKHNYEPTLSSWSHQSESRAALLVHVNVQVVV